MAQANVLEQHTSEMDRVFIIKLGGPIQSASFKWVPLKVRGFMH